MRIFYRILIMLIVVPATFLFLYWVPFSLVPFIGHRWIPGAISALFAAGVGWYAWWNLGATQKEPIQNAMIGALVLGSAGFTMGFFGPMWLAPDANLGPLLGIFITGPAGLFLGAILGFIAGKSQETIGAPEHTGLCSRILKSWTWLLWSCGLFSVIVLSVVLIYVPWHEARYSSLIAGPSDLQKRDKTLTSLSVRFLSDDEILLLGKFAELAHLDFFSGWGVAEARLTDAGLKNILELHLPKLDTLMLGYCYHITDEGMTSVARITTLKYLSLAACSHITDKGLDNLSASTSLETIDLRGIRGITDKGLLHLKRMPKLKKISLGGCNNISPARIEELRKALPNTRIEKDDKDWAMCAT